MYTLRLSDRFDTNLPLQSGGVMVEEYEMRAGTPSGPRGEVLPTDTVTETIMLVVTGNTQAQVQERIQRIERMLSRAHNNRGQVPADAVYLYIKMDDDDHEWRSEILDGQVSSIHPLRDLWKKKVGLSIAITRRPFWESAQVSDLLMTSAATSTATEAPIHGNNANNTWVRIAANQVPGTLPAPIELEIEDSVASEERLITGVWAINNAHVAPDSVNMYRTGAQSTAGNGNISGPAASVRWQLPAGLLDNVAGQYVRALLVLNNVPRTARVQGILEVAVSGGSTFLPSTTNDFTEVHWQVVDLGVFPMPPGGVSAGFRDLYFRASFLGTPTLAGNVKFLHMIPVSCEKRLDILSDFEGFGYGPGGSIVDNSMTGESYILDGTKKLSLMLPRGGPLLVYPGLNQRISILWTGFSGQHSALESRVRVRVRARRSTV